MYVYGHVYVFMLCVYVYAVVFDWYLIRMSVRSGVLGVDVVKHVFHLLDGRCVWCRCY